MYHKFLFSLYIVNIFVVIVYLLYNILYAFTYHKNIYCYYTSSRIMRNTFSCIMRNISHYTSSCIMRNIYCHYTSSRIRRYTFSYIKKYLLSLYIVLYKKNVYCHYTSSYIIINNYYYTVSYN